MQHNEVEWNNVADYCFKCSILFHLLLLQSQHYTAHTVKYSILNVRTWAVQWGGVSEVSWLMAFTYLQFSIRGIDQSIPQNRVPVLNMGATRERETSDDKTSEKIPQSRITQRLDGAGLSGPKDTLATCRHSRIMVVSFAQSCTTHCSEDVKKLKN